MAGTAAFLHTGSHGSALAWHWDPPVVVGLLVAAGGYAALAPRLDRRGGRGDGRAAAAWYAGLVVILLAIESPLDAIGEQHLLAAHMLQHGLLMTVAPPLLLLGLYPRLVVPATRPLLRPLLRNPRSHRVLAVVAGPPAALAIWLAIVAAWHVPALYDAALASSTTHVAQHLLFVTGGLLLWLPVLEPLPGLVRLRPAAKLAYLAAAQAATGVIAAVLVWSPEVVYGHYGEVETLWGLTRLGDQQLGAALMMVLDMVVALAAASWIVLRALLLADWRAGRGAPEATGG